MRNILLTIEYDGTNYFGWQRQPNKKTIQGVIEEAIKNITGEKVNLVGSGRTDAGVHALAQKANFKTASKIPVEKFPFALNSVLPNDISIKDAIEVSLEFSARYSAKQKTYKYLIYNHRTRPAILRNYAYYFPYDLDIVSMQRSCEYFIGEYDFSSFCSSGSETSSKVRKIFDCYLTFENECIAIYITANGFLYNMARIIAGTILDVGAGRIKPTDIPLIIESKDRTRAGKTLPPWGLYLVDVIY
ncbi:tRNA pseudouridine(38-40) synthase TruA [Caldicellulosiruptor morganii]|uniref:tRNA pseudouridine synthase A n=1 Tax=Caldicellulosiruptor morganii TaxID=1387555 RepID=A0ABY7BM67_9FIRM|nr:tRNA pseudouridine(38-40) synthase TruA [Caldicellulosiruptor morganii]WAM32972.1 tRNA pseudouridine(38-40) synthase TruA [Caldicellulosiruptor morganii]